MLSITDAWTYETEQTPNFALWFAAVDATGGWWWLITWVSRAFGFEGAMVQRVAGRAAVLRELELVEADAAVHWRALDPATAVGRVRDEFERAQTFPWTHIYGDHFHRITREYQRWQAAVAGAGPPEEDAGQQTVTDASATTPT